MANEARTLIQRWQRLKSQRDESYSALWEAIARYTLPRKQRIMSDKSPGQVGWVDRIYDTTASEANLVLAAGIVTNTTPATDRWFAFESAALAKARGPTPDVVQRWHADCRQIIMEILAGTNFHSEIHEAHLERGAFGTCAFMTREGDHTPITFECLEAGSYAISANSDGLIDTVYHDFQLTARQFEQKFGEEGVRKCPMVQKALQDTEGNGADKSFEIIHAMQPNADWERFASGQGRLVNMFFHPYVSTYICVEDGVIVRESGLMELPVSVGRFLNWPGEVYGWSPGIQTLPLVRQLNHIEKQLDLLAELAADPRILIPSSLFGQVDMRAGGTTIFDENNPQAVPKEWMTGGRYDIGKDRVESARERIKDAYHNDLFRMFAEMTQRMTVFEAMQRVSEKLELFSPTFQRISNEMLTPSIRRIFSILYRAGHLPEAPDEAMVEVMDGEAVLPMMPGISYQGKLALAIKALETRSFVEFAQIMTPIADAQPDVWDWIDFDQLTPEIARNVGLSPNWIRRRRDVERLRQERQEAVEEAQALETAAEGAKAAGALGNAPPQLLADMTG